MLLSAAQVHVLLQSSQLRTLHPLLQLFENVAKQHVQKSQDQGRQLAHDAIFFLKAACSLPCHRNHTRQQRRRFALVSQSNCTIKLQPHDLLLILRVRAKHRCRKKAPSIQRNRLSKNCPLVGEKQCCYEAHTQATKTKFGGQLEISS